MISSSLFAF